MNLDQQVDQACADPDIARAAALIADPSRARILKALCDGRAIPATILAAEARVSPATASAHLAKLVDACLVTVRREGRNRYYELASTDVAAALEALAVISPPLPVTSLRQSKHVDGLRRSRTCYDHVAGMLGVGLMRALLDAQLLTGHNGVHPSTKAGRDRPASYGRDVRYEVTARGRSELRQFGVDLDGLPPRRPVTRYCVDWSERRQHHLAGALGAALTHRLFDLGWVRPGRSPRVIQVTPSGVDGLERTFAMDVSSWREQIAGPPPLAAAAR
ncbi:DNA-binding transcriptional regulator, ArsR family [Parafrankia irregularis]|uniref:DNA-binding transcriptional regulator, ArsR family n=1 Tax=Parafrankia irregularis TaxID=795642 RepID=A0A0S4QI39_9ACTN|nr:MULTISPECIES: metalloregulator ArsR/SmtB family transcription factor [Parafrankia]MBE3204169.1 winged helix-turn-helix transcriptional regulator [Parafrankia sp. CH37]CUU54953.1 DNA-binding transcriptional regulator, ArsR family [Parafrankia irregularis]